MTSEAAVIDAHGRHAQAVQFTKDGKHLVSAGQDACIRLWSVPGFLAAGIFAGHGNSVNSLSLNADESLLATGSTDRTVRLWSFPEGRCLRTFEQQVTGVFSPDGDCLATISTKGQVVLWEASSGSQLASIPKLDARTTSIAFSPDGKSLLIGGTGAIHRVAVATCKKEGELIGHKAVVACLRVSPDRKWLASTGADGCLRCWSTRDWAEVRSVKLAGSGVLQIAFAPASDAVTIATDHVIESFSMRDGTLVDRIEVPVKGLYGVAISPDAKYLANAAADGRIRVWERAPTSR